MTEYYKSLFRPNLLRWRELDKKLPVQNIVDSSTQTEFEQLHKQVQDSSKIVRKDCYILDPSEIQKK